MNLDAAMTALGDSFRQLSDLDGQMDDLNQRIALLRDELAELSEHREGLTQNILGLCESNGLDNAQFPGYAVRVNRGRSSTRWDAAGLDRVLPDDLKATALTYTPKADAKVLAALEKAGKLPADALACREITPANVRLVLERVAQHDPEGGDE